MDKFTIYMENEFNKLETAYQMSILEESIIQNDYAFSVYTENDEGMDYFTEAENKINEKKKNIFNKMIDWFKEFFRKIKDKILELLGKKPKQYEMWDKAPEVEKGLKGFVQTLKNKFNRYKKTTDYEATVLTLKTIGVVTLILNIPVIAGMVVMTVENVQAEGIIKGVKTSMIELEKYILKMNDTEFDEYKSAKSNNPMTLLSFLRDIVSGIMKFIVAAFRPLGNFMHNTTSDILSRAVFSPDEYAQGHRF